MFLLLKINANHSNIHAFFLPTQVIAMFVPVQSQKLGYDSVFDMFVAPDPTRPNSAQSLIF